MELKVSETCITCNKAFQEDEVIIGKIPENIWFCSKCSDKYKDNTKYQIGGWIPIGYKEGSIVTNK